MRPSMEYIHSFSCAGRQYNFSVEQVEPVEHPTSGLQHTMSFPDMHMNELDLSEVQ